MLLKKIAIFASGSGSNAENIHDYFSDFPEIEVATIITNNPKAFVIERAQQLHIDCQTFDQKSSYKNGEVVDYLIKKEIDLIVLAGFLWLIPSAIVTAFPNKIINIHPALLPKYGGKGMYGDRVHQAVFDAKEKETGITIHYVNEHYDEGQIIFQQEVNITNDDAKTIAQKVHALEYEHLPKIVEQVVLGQTD